VPTTNRHATAGEGTIVPSLLDYLRVVGRWKHVFILIVTLFPATAVAVSLIQAPTYRASAEVLLSTQVPEGTEVAPPYIDPQRVAQTRAALARIPAVVNQALAEVPSAGLDRTEFLESSTVSTELGSDLLTFSVENSDPRLAMQLATAYAQAFTGYQEQFESDTVAAEVVRSADQAPKVGPRTVRNGLLAFCLGLVLALIVVFLADALDTRVRSVDAIRQALGLRLLGRLTTPPSRLRKRNELVMLADPTSREAEQFRALRWSLDLANAEHGARTIMITSAIEGEGKSTTAANLAVALARAGRRVVLIDADLTDPRLHQFFDLEPRPGLADLELGDTWLVSALRPINLREDSSGADDSTRRIERAGSLEVLPAGSALPNPDELGFEEAVGGMLLPLLDRSDIVLVDAPPLLRSNAIALSSHVDAVVLVVRLKGLRGSALEDVGWMLEDSRATKLGFVVTGADKTKVYGPRQRYAPSKVRPRPAPTVSPTADGDGELPAETRSKSPARPFGGLSPREAALRGAQRRRAKSAERAEAEKHAARDEAREAIEDA
jgi:capsular exopolysaccharide synthesis family protein